MKLQVGTIYMANIMDLDNPVMGVIVRRMWWKPWRYSVQPVYYPGRRADGGPTRAAYGETVSNLTKFGAVGYMKLWGVGHKDFEE